MKQAVERQTVLLWPIDKSKQVDSTSPKAEFVKDLARSSALVAMILVILSAITDIIGVEIQDWTFYDNYVEAIQSQEQKEMTAEKWAIIKNLFFPEKAAETDERIIAAFDRARNTVRQALKQYDQLNWERFEETGIGEYADGLSDGTEEGSAYDILYLMTEPVAAQYIDEDNMVYAYRKSEWLDDYELEKVMGHELIHALTVGESSNILYEGLTEYLTTLVYPDSTQISYEYAVIFVRLFAEKYGVNEAIKVFPSRDCFRVMDNIIGRENVTETLEALLYQLALGDSNSDEKKVALDVLCHYGAAIGGDIKVVEELIEQYPDEIIDKDAKNYFLKTLKTIPASN